MRDSQPGMRALGTGSNGPDVDPAARILRLWQTEEYPDLDRFLAEAAPLSPAEFADVLRVDQRYRWESGERTSAEHYLTRYPNLLDDPESAVDFVYAELLLREQHGEDYELETFVRRFPGLAETLRQQIVLHQALRAGPPTAAAVKRPRTANPIDRNQTCGQFEIVRAIGRGGAGIVYEARQPNVNRRVALKMLSAGAHADPEQLVRFRAEAEAVGRLQHPNIVQIYEAGQWEGCPYLALEFVHGGSLRSRLNGAPQSPQASATLIETLARAMHAAHLAGVVHRDLKPANILFSGAPPSGNEGRPHGISWSADEVPKIADFGLAKAVSGPDDDAEALTQTGDLLGTPSYMSPEQASGHRDQIGPTTDVYGLGAILYELLTGRPPFQGVTVVEVLQHVLLEDPVSPARLQPRLPRDLEIICLKCLQKQPARRYATALDLADDLRRFVAGEPIQARPTPRLARLGRWCRRNPVLAGLGGLIGVLAAALIVGSLAATVRLQKAAGERLAEARLAEARAVRLENRLGRREKIRTLLAEAARLRPSAEARNEAVAGMALFDLPQRDYGPIVTLDKGWLDFDGGLARYARTGRDGRITVARLSDGVEICRLPEPAANDAFRLSPDGQYLAVRSVETGTLDFWSLHDAQPRLIYQDHSHASYALGAFDFSGDSRLIAVGRPDGTVSIRSVPPGPFLQEWKHDSVPHHIAFRPHHSQIAVAGLDAVQIRDYETGRLLVRLEGSSGATWVAWHPAGQRLATVDNDQGISLWEPDERRRALTLRGPSAGATTLRFNSSGTLLCSQAWDEVLRFWDPIGGDLLFAARTETAPPLRGASDRDAWAGILAGGQVQVWQADEHEVYHRLTCEAAAGEGFVHLAISPAGPGRNRLLAVVMEQAVRLWDLDSRRMVGVLPRRSVKRVAFDATGALWTSTTAEIIRWPMDQSGAESDEIACGPPLTIVRHGANGDFELAPDGRTLAAGGTAGAFVWPADHPDTVQWLQGHVDPRYVALSPDGRLVATGSQTAALVKVWDAQTAALVREIGLGSSRVDFSSDGDRLLTTDGGLALWSVNGWEKTWQGAGQSFSAIAVAPGGRTVAVETGAGVIVLYETQSGREIARLTDPNGHRQVEFAFSPDQRYLAGITYDFKHLCLWDLSEIGDRLQELGLAWDWPPARSDSARSGSPPTGGTRPLS